MGAALRGGNQVDVAFLQQLATFGQPQHGPVHAFVVAFHFAVKGFYRQCDGVAGALQQVVGEAVLV